MSDRPKKETTPMEINITAFFESCDPSEFSASRAEIGKDASKITWAHAKAEAERAPLLTTPDGIEAFRDYVKALGAWEPDEIAAWDDVACNALFIQFVAGDMREAGFETSPDDAAWKAYQERAEAGRCSGNLYRDADGQVFYSLSH